MTESMSSAEDSHASQCPVPVKGRERKTKDGSGRSSTGSFAKLNQDGSWSKMYQDCCLLTLEGSLLEYSETWPQAGMMRNGISYRLPVLAHRTSEKECSLWPTPVSQDDNKSPEAHLAMKQRMKGGPRKKITSLNVMVKAVERGLWPTPTKSDGMGGPGCSGRDGGENLRTAVQKLPTPTSRDWRSGTGATPREGHAPMLPEVIGGQLSATWVCLLMGYPRDWLTLGDPDGKTEPRDSPSAKKTE